jgi:hypothetical protein
MKSKLAPADAGCGDWKVRNWPSGELGAHPATNHRKQTQLDARLNAKKTQAVHAAIKLLNPLIKQHKTVAYPQNKVRRIIRLQCGKTKKRAAGAARY